MQKKLVYVSLRWCWHLNQRANCCTFLKSTTVYRQYVAVLRANKWFEENYWIFGHLIWCWLFYILLIWIYCTQKTGSNQTAERQELPCGSTKDTSLGKMLRILPNILEKKGIFSTFIGIYNLKLYIFSRKTAFDGTDEEKRKEKTLVYRTNNHIQIRIPLFR